VILEVFNRQKWEKELNKNREISIVGFQCVDTNIEWWLKLCTLCLVYSQIWLNLPRNDHHFFYILLWMIATLAPNNNTPPPPPPKTKPCFRSQTLIKYRGKHCYQCFPFHNGRGLTCSYINFPCITRTT
jgi:hypothetical protein